VSVVLRLPVPIVRLLSSGTPSQPMPLLRARPAALWATALAATSATAGVLLTLGVVGPAGVPAGIAASLAAAFLALGSVFLGRGAAIPLQSPAPAPRDDRKEPIGADREAPQGLFAIDADGRLGDPVAFGDPSIAPLAAGHSLIDRIHVADRVGLLRALSGARQGASGPMAVAVRFNRLPPAEGQAFIDISMIVMPGRAGAPVFVAMAVAPTVEAEPAPAPGSERDADRLAIVSHELRTPLNAIIGFSELLRGEASGLVPPARRGEYVDLIHEAATHLLSVVNTMLDVSKIGAGRYAISRESFDLGETIRSATTMLAPRAAAKGIHINLHLENVTAPATADRRAVKQIVINLLSNAIKFTPDDGCVTIEAASGPDGIVLTVADTGIGIAEDEIAKLGQPFRQVDNSYTRQCEGTGLGLSLVKGLAGLHSGDMRIESAPSIGTRVTVTLPAADPARCEQSDGRITPLPARPVADAEQNQEEMIHAPLRFG